MCVCNPSKISVGYGGPTVESSRIDRIVVSRSTRQVQEEGNPSCLHFHQGESLLELGTVVTREELDAA